MDDVKQIEQIVTEQSDALKHAAKTVWEAAELNWREEKSAEALKQYLHTQGFSVTAPACGMTPHSSHSKPWAAAGRLSLFYVNTMRCPGFRKLRLKPRRTLSVPVLPATDAATICWEPVVQAQPWLSQQH